MTKTYYTSTGQVLISSIKGKEHFLLMHDEARTYKKLIDKITVNKMITQGNWIIKEN